MRDLIIRREPSIDRRWATTEPNDRKASILDNEWLLHFFKPKWLRVGHTCTQKLEHKQVVDKAQEAKKTNNNHLFKRIHAL